MQRLFLHNPIRVYLQRTFEAPEVLSGINLAPGSRCLEIGCGHGAGALLISQHVTCDGIVGVDIDPQAIHRARRYVARKPPWARDVRTDHIEFGRNDAATLSFGDNSFDAVFLFGVLNSVDDWKKVVAEVFRVLKPGGTFAFKEALRPSSFFFPGRFYFFVPVIREAELREYLIGIGFSIQRFKVNAGRSACFVRAGK